MRPVALLLAEGYEEVEAVTPIDFLRRAGIEVITAGVGRKAITGAHGITICADTTIDRLPQDLDGVILPGGMPGARNLHDSEDVKRLVLRMMSENRLVAAICAAPARVLAPMGILSGRVVTCFPGDEKEFPPDAIFTEDRVARDGSLVTSRGAGTAAEFAEEIIRFFKGDSMAKEIHLRTVGHA